MISIPLVTIMIPTYAQEKLILKAVESALAQDYANLEVVVADDASPDNTEQILAHISDPRFKYHRNTKNLGRVANYRNILYNLANGIWVVNLDGDDYYIDSTFISQAMEFIAKHGDVVLVSADCKTITPTKERIKGVPDDKIIHGFDVLGNLTNEKYRFNHMTTIYNRKLAMSCNFYHLDVLSTDWESLYRLASLGKVAYLNRVVGVWNLHGNNDSLSVKWCELFDNIRIWDSIFNFAQQNGMNMRRVFQAKQKIIKFIAYHNLSSILRTGDYKSALKYLRALRQYDYKIFFGLATYHKVVIKMGLSLILPSYLNKPL